MSLVDLFLLGYLVLTVGALLALWHIGPRPQMNVPAVRRPRPRVFGPARARRERPARPAITLERR